MIRYPILTNIEDKITSMFTPEQSITAQRRGEGWRGKQDKGGKSSPEEHWHHVFTFELTL
jgi:hypothetical protein